MREPENRTLQMGVVIRKTLMLRCIEARVFTEDLRNEGFVLFVRLMLEPTNLGPSALVARKEAVWGCFSPPFNPDITVDGSPMSTPECFSF